MTEQVFTKEIQGCCFVFVLLLLSLTKLLDLSHVFNILQL